MLDVRGIAKHYGDVVALDGVSLSVARGQLVGFLGPNGAGKTTTMRAILQLVALDGGTITWDRSPITPDVRRRFGYMPAERGMYPKMRVRDHVTYMARLAGLDHDAAGAAADRWLDRVGLAGRADAEVQDLSSGNQQRVQLALALVNDPELLVLDEPFSGLDPVAVEVLKDVLLERVAAGAALLFSSHQLDLVEDLTRDVVIIDGGRVVLEGDVEAIRQGAASREVEVHFDGPTTWHPDGELPGATVTSRDGDRLRLRVPATTAADEVLAAAGRHGTVTSFSFAPPDLSEVFLATVGRPRPDGPRPDGDRPEGGAR